MATQTYDSTQEEPGAGGGPTAADRALACVRTMFRAFHVFSKSLERRHGMSGAQLEILEHLRERPALSLGELTGRTAADQSTISVLVKRLVARGLVHRTESDGDRRRMEVSLAPEGMAFLAHAPPSVGERLRDGFLRLEEAERRTLVQLLERWVALSGLRR
ncbi:MAG: MarR family winged helix-turn-helix transcriptional regulator [Gemmatimonadaceae bacterium]